MGDGGFSFCKGARCDPVKTPGVDRSRAWKLKAPAFRSRRQVKACAQEERKRRRESSLKWPVAIKLRKGRRSSRCTPCQEPEHACRFIPRGARAKPSARHYEFHHLGHLLATVDFAVEGLILPGTFDVLFVFPRGSRSHCLPLPSPCHCRLCLKGVRVGSPKLSRRRFLKLCKARVLHVTVCALNQMYLGRFPTMDELGRRPNSSQQAHNFPAAGLNCSVWGFQRAISFSSWEIWFLN